MYFTKTQKNALLFLVIIFALVVVYNLFERVLNPNEPYDFSKFEEKFNARSDSIKRLIKEGASTSEIYGQNETYKTPQPPNEPKHNKAININSAPLDELTSLPRIGPAIGERIINYRNINGRFLKKEDIQNVKGIGPKTYEGLKDLIRVD
jgi:comEA protein